MFSNKVLGCILLAIFFALLPLDLWSAENPILTKDVEISIQENVKVSGSDLLLGDIATIYARDIADFEKLSRLQISKIPNNETSLELPSGYLNARISEVLAGKDFQLHSPAKIHFELNQIGVRLDELNAEIIAQGKLKGKIPQDVEVELEALSGVDALKTAELKSFRVEAAGERAVWRGEMPFKLVGRNGEVQWLRLKLRWYGNAWVAKQDIRFGETLSASQFEPSRTEISSDDAFLSTRVTELNSVLGNSRTKRMIRARTPLVQGMLDRKPDAIAGQNLKVVFISESGLQVSADGLLVNSGSIGSDAKARLRSSKKIVSGRLVSSGVMEVSL